MALEAVGSNPIIHPIEKASHWTCFLFLYHRKLSKIIFAVLHCLNTKEIWIGKQLQMGFILNKILEDIMKRKLCVLFVFLCILISFSSEAVFAASVNHYAETSSETIGKIQIYTSKDAFLLLDDKKVDVQGRSLYDAFGKEIGSTDAIGSSGRKVYIVDDGTYTVLNSSLVEVQYLKMEGLNYINVGDRIKYDALEASTTCVCVGEYDSKEVTVQPLTDEQKTLLENVIQAEEKQEMLEKVHLEMIDMFSEKNLNSRTFYILENGIEFVLYHNLAFQIACALIFVLFCVMQFFLCVKIKKLFVVKLLPFLCTCGCAMIAVSYLMDYYGKYSANDPGMANGLAFWQRVVTSMGKGCLFGLAAAIVYQIGCMLVRSILKKKRAPKVKEK